MEAFQLAEGCPPRRTSRDETKTRKSAGGRRRKADHIDKRLDRLANVMRWMIPPAAPEETHFRHSHWSDKRTKVRAAIAACGANTFQLDRFDNCGSECQVEWSEQQQRPRLRANYCKCRHCEPCAKAKANLIAGNLRRRLEQRPAGRYRFVTLTLRHCNDPLDEQIRRLFSCFRRLRQLPIWKKTQAGGAFVLECKHGDAGWHPHLHVVTEGAWIKQADLAGQWLKVTGDSHVVDIRALSDAGDAAHYVSKYISKSTSAGTWHDPRLAVEWVVASRGVRTCSTFGTWRGFKLLSHEGAATDWVPLCSLKSLVARAMSGEVHAQQMLLILRPPGSTDEVQPRARDAPQLFGRVRGTA